VKSQFIGHIFVADSQGHVHTVAWSATKATTYVRQACRP